MSFRTVQKNNIANRMRLPGGTVNALGEWVRNPTWTALASITSADQKFVGLHLVAENANFVAVNFTAVGGYTVDWGDGTAPQNYTSATQANYEYDFAAAGLADTNGPVTFTDTGDTVNRTAHGYSDGMTISFNSITTTTGIVARQIYYVVGATANTFQVSATLGGTALDLTTDGTGIILPFKLAVVIITPTNGANNFTGVNINLKHNQAGLVSGYCGGWLDIAFAGAYTSLTIGGVTIPMGVLQRANILQSSLTSYTSLFSTCRALSQVVGVNSEGTVTSASNMFLNCTSLQTVPLFNTAAVTEMAGIFSGCRSLQTVPLFNTTALIGMSSMFAYCESLEAVPLFNTATVTNMSNMFFGCTSLQTVPLFNTISVTSMTAMFGECRLLHTVPLFNTAAVTVMSSMFQSCSSLQEVPLFNTAAVTNMSSMFNGCSLLQTVPLFNTATVTNTSSMFSSCSSLQTVPLLNTAAVTNMTTMFSTCPSLSSVLVAPGITFTVANCKLSAAALDALYTELPTVTARTLTVTGNYGASTSTTSIATAKGWTVVT